MLKSKLLRLWMASMVWFLGALLLELSASFTAFLFLGFRPDVSCMKYLNVLVLLNLIAKILLFYNIYELYLERYEDILFLKICRRLVFQLPELESLVCY